MSLGGGRVPALLARFARLAASASSAEHARGVAASSLAQLPSGPVVSPRRKAPLRLARVAPFAAAALLCACTSLPKVLPAADSIAGRLSVRVEDVQPRSVSAAFELRGSADAGQLDLNSPLGNVMARASWTPGEALLTTPDGQARYGDLDALGREVLGESLPMAALFDWLRGRPWPDAPSTPVEGGASFVQLGWTVNLANFDDGLIVATRAAPPAVTVRARVER